MKAIASGGAEDPAEEKPAAKPEAKAEEKPGEKPATEKKPEEKPAGELALSTEAKTALATLINAGHISELAKLVGADQKAADASGAKLSLVRKRLTEATDKEKSAQGIRDECKRMYGSPHKAKKAVDEGKFAEAAQWIADTLQIDFATFTRKVADATKGMDPKELERFQKDRELKDREKALEERERTTTEARSKADVETRSLKVIEGKCAGMGALKLRGGARLVLRRMEENFDDKTGVLRLGYKQAADQVLEEFEADARALGYSKGAPATPEKKPETKTEETPRGKKPFQPAAAETTEQEPASGKRKGSTLEERQARADRQFQRSRPL